MLIPEFINASYSGKMVFSDVIQSRILGSSWIIWIGPKHDKYPYKKHTEKTGTQWESKVNTVADRSDVVTSQGSQGTQTIMRSWKRQGRIFPQSLWRDCNPTDTLIYIYGLWNFEMTNFVVLSHPPLLWQSQDNNNTSSIYTYI